MTLLEFKVILRALGIDPIQAIVTADELDEEVQREVDRHHNTVAMLCSMFRGLPLKLLAAIDEVEGADGTEIRPEWAVPLQRNLITRLVQEVTNVVSRRSALADFGLLR